MTLSDLLFLLRLDLKQLFRLRQPRGKRGGKSRRGSLVIHFIMLLVGVGIGWGVYFIGTAIGWTRLRPLILNNLEFGNFVFNAILLFGFIGSVMYSAMIVANSARMEYVLTMPVATRTIFLEKTLVLVFAVSEFWILLGTPVVAAVALVAGWGVTIVAALLYVSLVLVFIGIGVGAGGLVGLAAARLVAGHRTVKQAGYFILTALAILASTFWYYNAYFAEDSQFLGGLISFGRLLGLTSDTSPGRTFSVLILGTIAGGGVTLVDVLTGLGLAASALILLYVNAVVSEAAHYSGWLTYESTRSSDRKVRPRHGRWAPRTLPLLRMSQTCSASMWYNITSIRRKGGVLAQYLLNPLRFTVFLLFPVLTAPEELLPFMTILVAAAAIPFAVSYGVYFAGYETVYEGKNLMNLQLAAANFEEYTKGKVYSALPFSLAASVLFSIVALIVNPPVALYVPLLIIAMPLITLIAGPYAAFQAAVAGDFKAERMILRQRGAAAQPPITGLAALKVQLVPNLAGFALVLGMLVIGIFVSPLYAYLVLAGVIVVAVRTFRSYSHSAGVELAQIEASKYL